MKGAMSFSLVTGRSSYGDVAAKIIAGLDIFKSIRDTAIQYNKAQVALP
jgi:hypothetical protein